MNSARLEECIKLSSEILNDFELSEMQIGNIVLKCLRLCRLLGDEDGILLFTFEASEYPETEDGLLTTEAWRIAKIAGRRYWKTENSGKKKDKRVEYASTSLLSTLENQIVAQRSRLSAAQDPSISLSSANPSQVVFTPTGNVQERRGIVESIGDLTKKKEKIKGSLYQYILEIYNKLQYGNIIEDTFTKSRLIVNNKLSKICPKSLERFVTVYNNMDSNNDEDWANAVHTCRRILLDLSDSLYPPSDTPLIIGGKSVKIGKDQYINRLIQYISQQDGSVTYKAVVGSDLRSIGERLDAINEAVCKGTHADVKKDEAARYIIHTYLLISDIVALIPNESLASQVTSTSSIPEVITTMKETSPSIDLGATVELPQ